MKTSKLHLQGLILIISFLFCSCEKEQLFQSESKVEKKLEATWEKIDMTSEKSHISWNFYQGKVSLFKYDELLASGDYDVKAGATRVHINISNFPEPGYGYMNGHWKVITLDDDILVIAGQDGTGVLESEFVKR